MKRYFLKVGDKSTAGGVVLEGQDRASHHGTALTYIGASVSCGACKTTGHIIAKGPRRPGTMMGKTAALDGDLCACQCSPFPTMIASQNTMSQSFEGHELASMGYSATAESIEAGSAIYDEQVILRDSETGQPLAGITYRIHSRSGKVVIGTTDTEGRTQRFNTEQPDTFVLSIIGEY
ncbi:PAAR domain-containing protein [Caballeronia sp. LZ016]|uniref:PAAR domain-containing protein n=1 Tax=Caballeronia sp. LZ016 TaxID=3038554 RepID=UPI0028678672|nr:PAAR domain-containing protein [Caballeronia sp. LZ016]MDR5740930.1 PAAR domain-containing protein [Caballeronia sp. LZ016]